MNLADPDERSGWRAYLGEIFADRLVICGLAPLAGFVDWVALLKAVGAKKPLLVATGRGAGPCPSEDDAESVLVDGGRFESMTEELRDQDRLARNLPTGARRVVERYDPASEAVWLMGPFVVNDPVLDRPVLGGRPAAWLALEDKLVADEIWAEAACPHADSAVTEVDLPRLRAASAALDTGHGTVWSGDARDGFNGGGDFVRWVTTPDEQRAAHDFFAARCDRVRVMPFLEGVPCSIHGIVLPDGTAAFRPVELAVLRTPDRRFVYGGQGTSWDPRPEDRDAMRDLVRRTGSCLRERVGYRGAFGIDGIMTRDGFRPTELNTRLSGGLSTLARTVDASAFNLLQFNAIAGRDPRVSVADLESWALPAMDARRVSKPIAIPERKLVEESLDIAVSWDGERLRRSGSETGLTLLLAPSAVGTYAKVVSAGPLEPGRRVAPLNVALMRFLDDELGAGIGPVQAPPDVRQST